MQHILGIESFGDIFVLFQGYLVWQSRLVEYSTMVGQLCNRGQIRYLDCDLYAYLDCDLYMHPVMFIEKNLEGTEDSLKGRGAELLR